MDTTLKEIKEHLRSLGAGNRTDNMERLKRFPRYCSETLPEREFLALVFMQSAEVVRICPERQDRTLRAVAQRAIDLGQPRLSDNWDLAANLNRMRAKLVDGKNRFESLVLCEASNGEDLFGPWYIQDGSHRALAYATLVLLNIVPYEPQVAYCAMNDKRYQSLLIR